MPPDPTDTEEDEAGPVEEDSSAREDGPDSNVGETSAAKPPRQELEVLPEPELEVLPEPSGVESVISPIDDAESPEAHLEIESEPESDEVEVDDIEEIDDIEELEDFEVIDDADMELSEAPTPAPPPLPKPPPMPARAKSPSSAPKAVPPKETGAPRASAARVSAPPPMVPVSEAAPALEETLTAPDAVSVLDQLLDGREALDWKVRAEKLSRELEQAEGRTRIGELAYELGDLYQRHLENEAAAVKAYGRALQADPSLRANLWAIRRIFYRRKLWPNLVKLIGAELRFTSAQRHKADLHLERGRILVDFVGDPNEAQASFEQAVGLDPQNIGALLALQRIARQNGDKATLWRSLKGLAEASSEPERKAAYLIELAREYRSGGENLDEARAVLAEAAALGVLEQEVSVEREALALDSDDASSFAASLERRIAVLAEVFGAAGPPEQLEAAEASGSAQVLRQMLALRRHQSQVLRASGDHEGAWSCLQEALQLAPEDPLLLTDLTELAEATGRYEELATLVAARESGEADPGRALSLALRRASALAKAGKQEEADELLRARARATPGYLPLVVARELQAGRQENWLALSELQAELGDALRLGTVFGPGADTEPEPKEAAAHYVVSGDLLRFGSADLEAARQRYLQALEVQKGHRPAIEALCSLYLQQGRYAEMAGLLETHLQHSQATEKPALQERLAATYFLLGEADKELASIEALLLASPHSSSYQARRLALLRETSSYASLAEAAKAAAEESEDPQRAAQLYFEAGRIWMDHLQRPVEAASCFRKCAEAWPGEVIVQACLSDALRAAEDWSGLAEQLAQQLESCADGPELSALGREALIVAEFHLEESPEAIALARRVSERAPEDLALQLDASASLDRVKSTSGAVLEAKAEILERLSGASDPGLRESATLELARVQLARGDQEEAERCCQDAAEGGSLPALLSLHAMGAKRSEVSGLLASEPLVALAAALEAQGEGTTAASLLERAGWLCATRDEEEQASIHFSSAAEQDPSRPGPLVGACLLAARADSRALQGECLERLASIGTGAYASSAMLLRAGMLADVAGDERLALERLEQSRRIAPQDAGTAVMTADRLHPLPPHCTLTVEELMARAELCDMRSVLADAGPARIDWELERAEALELAGHLREAAQAVASVLDQRPEDIRGLQALKRICCEGGDKQGQARAAVALAKQIGDSRGRLALLREAAKIFDEELGEVGAAVATYRHILEEEPGAGEYERLVSLLSEHQDIRALYRCYSARLNHLDIEGEQRLRVPIFLARARLREKIGDLRGASRDYKSLLAIDPNCLDALLERARLLERFDEAADAADHFQRFLALEVDPERRASAELSLSHLMADSLDDINGAIEQLEHVVRQTPRDLDVRERLIALLIKAKRIDEAVTLIRELGGMRASDGERARDELRIAALLKDRDDKGPAMQSLSRARQYDPLNMDAVRDLIALSGGGGKREELLRSATDDILRAIAEEPVRGSLYERLVTLGAWGENTRLRRQALQALATASSLSAEQRNALNALGEPLPTIATALGQDAWRSSVQHHDAGGFAAELWTLIGPAVAEITDGTPAGLGFERSHKVKAKGLAKAHPVIGELAAFLGLETLEVYVSERRVGVARAVSAEVPTICLGAQVAGAESREQRFSLARSMAHAKAGTGSAAELEESELCVYFAAAAQLAGVSPLPSGLKDRVDASVLETQAKRLAKSMGRRARKDLTLLASRFSELGDPMQWRRGTQQSAARLGLLVCGSLSAAFEVMDVGKGGRSLSEDAVAQGLIAWSVSDKHLRLLEVLEQTKGKHV